MQHSDNTMVLTAAGLHPEKESALKGIPNAIATKTTDAIQQQYLPPLAFTPKKGAR
jgi:hypothetical protein